MPRARTALAIAVFASSACSLRRAESRFEAPAGFWVEVAATATLTGQVARFTFDSFGRPVVAGERGFPIVLTGKDGEGRFEAAKVFSPQLSQAGCFWFDGRTLYAVGRDREGQPGVYRMEDTDGDDSADTFEQLNQLHSEGEPGCDIRRGPDGHPSLLLSAGTMIPSELVDPASPAMAGPDTGATLVRLNLDRRRYTILATGLGNVRTHAHDFEGEAYTFENQTTGAPDSPWRREPRLLRLVPGGDYGWRASPEKFPEYYFDSLPPEQVRPTGSVVAIEFYQHEVYPESFRGALLEADRANGKIRALRLRRSSEPGDTATDLIRGPRGAITDFEVGPDGFVYFSTSGGRGNGTLYRIRFRPPLWDRIRGWKTKGAEGAIIRSPQPLSSWGHSGLLTSMEGMFGRWGSDLEAVARHAGAASSERVQAVVLLERFGPRPSAELLRALAVDSDSRVRAAALYSAGLHGGSQTKSILASGLKDPDAFVRRRAAEAIVRAGIVPEQAPIDDIYALLSDGDRFTRWAARLALERTPRTDWEERALGEENATAAAEGLLAWIRTAPADEDFEPLFGNLLSWLARGSVGPEDLLRLLRLFHVAASRMPTGVRHTLRKQVSDLLIPRFPNRDERASRELALTLAYCGQPEAIGRILDAMPPGEQNQPLQVYYAQCLRSIESGWTEGQKSRFRAWSMRSSSWSAGSGSSRD